MILFSFVSITVAVGIARNYPAVGYEYSLYSTTPVSFWLFVMCATVTSALVLLSSAVSVSPRFGAAQALAFTALLTSQLVIHILPELRGYYTLQGDQMTNIGFAIDILTSGRVATDDFYPITHTYLGSLSLLTGIDVLRISNVSTGFIAALGAIVAMLLGREIFGARGQLIVAAFGGAVSFNSYSVFLMPAGWSIMLIPLLIHSIIRSSESRAYQFVAVVLALTYPFLHPLTSLLVVAMAVFALIAVQVIRGREDVSAANIVQMLGCRKVVIVAVVLIPWILSFQVFNPNLRLLVESIVSGSSPDLLSQIGVSIFKLGLDTASVFGLIVLTMTDELMVLFASLLVAFALLKGRRLHWDNSTEKVYLVTAFVALPSIGYLTYLFNVIPGMGYIAADRLLAYASVLAVIPFTYVVTRIIDSGGKPGPTLRRRMTSAALVFILLLPAATSAVTVFPSPITHSPSPQVTSADVEAFRLLSETRDASGSIHYILANPKRLGHLLFGTGTWNSEMPYVDHVPDHFAYNESDLVDHSVVYIIVTSMDIVSYTTVWANVNRFTAEDFDGLESRPDISLYCDNGDVRVFVMELS